MRLLAEVSEVMDTHCRRRSHPSLSSRSAPGSFSSADATGGSALRGPAPGAALRPAPLAHFFIWARVNFFCNVNIIPKLELKSVDDVNWPVD